MKIKQIKPGQVTTFIAGHPTFSHQLTIPDVHIEEFFMPTEIQMQKIKAIFYEYMRNSLDELIDEMDKGFEYVQALRIIKKGGWSLPLRVRGWGYKEPLTVDELLDKLDKNIEEKQKGIEKLREEQQDLLRKKDSFEFQIRSVDEKISKVKKIEKEHKDLIDNLRNNKDKLKKILLDINGKLSEDSGLVEKVDKKKRDMAKAQEELA